MKSLEVIQMKATEKHLFLALFIMLHMMLILEPVDEIVKFDG